MSRSIYQLSFANSIYFSFASFFILWVANFLHEYLKKTTGSISFLGTIIIVFTTILVIFLFSISSIVFSHEALNSSVLEKVLAVILFLASAFFILGLLGVLFFFPV